MRERETLERERGGKRERLFPYPRNNVSEIADFLSQLTVKTQTEADQFFASLPGQLHSLPPRVVAEHLLPLLLTPLVMTQNVARRYTGFTEREGGREGGREGRRGLSCGSLFSSSLWKHLLTPASTARPRRMNFDPTKICPLLDEELFTYHAVPVLLNLMESHDYHVRMVLLEHLLQFAPLCPREELVGSLLPEVTTPTERGVVSR